MKTVLKKTCNLNNCKWEKGRPYQNQLKSPFEVFIKVFWLNPVAPLGRKHLPDLIRPQHAAGRHSGDCFLQLIDENSLYNWGKTIFVIVVAYREFSLFKSFHHPIPASCHNTGWQIGARRHFWKSSVTLLTSGENGWMEIVKTRLK